MNRIKNLLSGLVSPPRSPADLAAVLLQLTAAESGERLREHYLTHFTVERYLTNLARAFRSLEEESAAAGGSPLEPFPPAV